MNIRIPLSLLAVCVSAHSLLAKAQGGCEIYMTNPPTRFVSDVRVPDFRALEPFLQYPLIGTTEPMGPRGLRQGLQTGPLRVIDAQTEGLRVESLYDGETYFIAFWDFRRLQFFLRRPVPGNVEPYSAVFRFKDFERLIGQRFELTFADGSVGEHIIQKFNFNDPSGFHALETRNADGRPQVILLSRIAWIRPLVRELTYEQLRAEIRLGIVGEYFAFPTFENSDPSKAPTAFRGRVIEANDQEVVIRFRGRDLEWHDRTLRLDHLDMSRPILKLS